MRKLTILLAVAALATSAGCGRCRSWFHKGSPCGTLLSPPAALAAPMAISGPVMQQQMCVPCDPCLQYDPCGTTGVSTGYFGGYMSGAAADCGCDPAAGGAVITTPAGALPAGGYPAPAT